MVSSTMTDLEQIVARWLERRKIDYAFQVPILGGYYSLGGMVVDFVLSENWIAMRVMGEYWHRGAIPEGKALIQKEQLEAMGWKVVDVWGQDLQERLEETMQKAIVGEEMLH